MRGAFSEGAKTGLILATVECAIRSVINPLVSPFVTADALSTIFLPFVVYPLVVAVLTSLVSLLIAARPELTSIAITAILVAGAAAPMVGKGTRYGMIVLGLTIVAGCVFAWRFLNAWTASILLIASPWIARELLLERSRQTKVFVALLLIVGTAAAVIVLRRMKLRIRIPVWAIAPVVAAVALILSPNVRIRHPKTRRNPRPNVLLVTLDTVRADHVSLGWYGRDTTPQLAAFARGATLYRKALAPSNYTLPSHTSMFTGLYGTVHGNHGVPGQFLSPRVATLAETLNEHGYATISVVGNAAYLRSPFRLDRGFGYHDARWRLDVAYSPRDALLFLRRRAALAPYRRADEIEAEAEALLRDAARGTRPFFLFVNFMDAHDPYAPPGRFASLFPGRIRGLAVEPLIERLLGEMPHATISPAERAHLFSQYDGGIAFIDDRLGKLLSALRDIGAADDTIVIIASDHGEGFGEHGFVKHGNSLYNEELRVPLVIKYPHQSIAAVRDDVVSLNDIYATALQAVGIPPPHRQQGIALQGKPSSGRIVLSENFGDGVSRVAFDGRWKLFVEPNGATKLFDIVNDPSETHDLHAIPPSLMNAVAALAQEPTLAATGSPLDEEAIRRLRALGYLH